MKRRISKTKKAAASIYIVIFTTTLLGVIALSFVRIMLAESLRTTNYSLSQSAYNSALAGIEDAKIVLLRYQNCLSFGNYSSATSQTKNCSDYEKAFGNMERAHNTAKKCDTVGEFLHNTKEGDMETVIQTTNEHKTDAIDQAYTCVKISAYTEDFLAVLKEDASTKIIPLRAENQEAQNSINRIQLQWFDQGNYDEVRYQDSGALIPGFSGINSFSLASNNPGIDNNYANSSNSNGYGYGFGNKPIVPPALQVTYMQTADSFTANDFYASAGINNESSTNRGTLLLRPTDSNTIRQQHKIVTGTTNNNFSNILDQNSLAYSANKSFNSPIDVYCDSDGTLGGDWGSYACSADFYVPKPIGALNGNRNMKTNFLVVSLPYGQPVTDIAVKMYSCKDATKPTSEKYTNEAGDSVNNCSLVEFANVQPMVDSTGRANDLFRRVESRIELADTSYPISNYALAYDGPSNGKGISKNYYVTKSNCMYTSSTWNGGANDDKVVYSPSAKEYVPTNRTCDTAAGENGQ